MLIQAPLVSSASPPIPENTKILHNWALFQSVIIRNNTSELLVFKMRCLTHIQRIVPFQQYLKEHFQIYIYISPQETSESVHFYLENNLISKMSL